MGPCPDAAAAHSPILLVCRPGGDVSSTSYRTGAAVRAPDVAQTGS